MDNRIKLLSGEFYGPVAASYPASGNLGMNNENICPFGVMANTSESHHFFPFLVQNPPFFPKNLYISVVLIQVSSFYIK